MKWSILVAIGLSLAPSTVQCRDWVNDSSFAVAQVSCADWTIHRKIGPDRWEADASWMFGFLTALVRAKGEARGGGMTAEDFPGEIDELCAGHPQLSAPAVLEMYAVQHGLIAPEPREKYIKKHPLKRGAPNAISPKSPQE